MPGGNLCADDRQQMEAAVPLQSACAPWRFNELHKSLNGISQKVLTDSLRAMERDGLVLRTAYAEVPSRVEYSLTELGESLRLIPLDVSSCIVGRAEATFEKPEMQALLKAWKLDEEYMPLVFVCLGYIDGEYPDAKKDGFCLSRRRRQNDRKTETSHC